MLRKELLRLGDHARLGKREAHGRITLVGIQDIALGDPESIRHGRRDCIRIHVQHVPVEVLPGGRATRLVALLLERRRGRGTRAHVNRRKHVEETALENRTVTRTERSERVTRIHEAHECEALRGLGRCVERDVNLC